MEKEQWGCDDSLHAVVLFYASLLIQWLMATRSVRCYEHHQSCRRADSKIVSTHNNVAILVILYRAHAKLCMQSLRCLYLHLQGYMRQSRIHILVLDLIMYSTKEPRTTVRWLFYGAFLFELGSRGYYSGHGHQIWLLNCIQTHITHSVTSPCFWCPQRPPALFSLFLSRGDSNESSTAQGHALLIAPLNEVIHNVATLWHTLADAHTSSSVRPRTYWNRSPSGWRCRKVNLTG